MRWKRGPYFRALLEQLPDVVTVVDDSGVITYLSPSVLRLFGYDASTTVGTFLRDLVAPDEAARLDAALSRARKRPDASIVVEVPMAHADGGWRDTEMVLTSLVDVPGIDCVVLSLRDVTERRQLHERLTQQAYYDALTGLANRSLFQRELAASWPSASPGSVAVLFCDLDGFKAVNDSCGHDVGDTLLGIIAERLRGSVRPADVVARFGGDEFAVLVRGVGAEQQARTVAARIAESLDAPVRLHGREIRVGVSIGVAVTCADTDSVDALLRNADVAMYRAKAHRNDSVVVFEASMQDALVSRLLVEDDLRAALDGGQMVLHYQPTVALATGLAVGVEALMRWYHPRRGIVAPYEFIDIAEETGDIEAFGEWALFEACRQGALWQRHALPGTAFSVGVNVAARQLTPALVDVVAAALADSGMPPSALLLEMTEPVLVGRPDETADVLRSLRRIGVRIAIDDFGSGHTSLSSLSRFAVDVLKIDKVCIDGVDARDGRASVARTIVGLGRALGIATIAEGVERQAQSAALRAMGCAFAQGYLFGRPLPAEGVTALLSDVAQSEAAQYGSYAAQDDRVVTVDG